MRAVQAEARLARRWYDTCDIGVCFVRAFNHTRGGYPKRRGSGSLMRLEPGDARRHLMCAHHVFCLRYNLAQSFGIARINSCAVFWQGNTRGGGGGVF